MHPNIIITIAAAIAMTTLMACTQPSMPEQSEGAVFFNNNCVDCHGVSGVGDGPVAASLPAPPTNLTTLSRKNSGAFPTARALTYIYGDPEKSHLSRVMPEFSDAMADDLVPVKIDGILTPTPRALAGLLVYLESIQN